MVKWNDSTDAIASTDVASIFAPRSEEVRPAAQVSMKPGAAFVILDMGVGVDVGVEVGGKGVGVDVGVRCRRGRNGGRGKGGSWNGGGGECRSRFGCWGWLSFRLSTAAGDEANRCRHDQEKRR